MKNAGGPFIGIIAVLAGFAPLSVCLRCQQPSTPALRADTIANSSALKVPLEFESNRGQASAEYPFVAHGPTYSLGLSPTDIALSLRRPHESSRVNAASALLDSGATDHSLLHLRLLGASKSASAAGLEP
jgi:hypothetical protein